MPPIGRHSRIFDYTTLNGAHLIHTITLEEQVLKSVKNDVL
jgi:hypothetical protein